jgi:hypothetical protein
LRRRRGGGEGDLTFSKDALRLGERRRCRWGIGERLLVGGGE